MLGHYRNFLIITIWKLLTTELSGGTKIMQ